MHGWFVCPTVSMVTTSNATGLEKTIANAQLYAKVHRVLFEEALFSFNVPSCLKSSGYKPELPLCRVQLLPKY